MRRVALIVSVLCLFGLMASACSRSDSLGADEAIEVLVLDGVDRARASCIVNNLEGQIDLRKITGFDLDLDDHELAALSALSSICAPALGSGGGLIAGGGVVNDPLSGETAAEEADVEIAVYRMVDEGLEAGLANCLILELSALEDPVAVLDDDVALASAIVACRDLTGDE